MRIVVTGGFTPARIRQFEDLRVPADVYGVGSWLLSSCDVCGTNNDFTADVVRVRIEGSGTTWPRPAARPVTTSCWKRSARDRTRSWAPPPSPSPSLAALLAGLVSFVSPCVLPIVPGYLSFISGVNVAQLKDQAPAAALTRRVFLTGLFFVLGFSTVFVALGAAATLVGELLQQHKRALGIVGGVVIIVLGLHTMGVLKIDWLLAEKRATVRERPLGLLGAYVVGLAFAFGWTPCIGPILAAILVYASQQETVTHGVLLLAAYSAGLGLPFLASALAINGFFRAFCSPARLDADDRGRLGRPARGGGRPPGHRPADPARPVLREGASRSWPRWAEATRLPWRSPRGIMG